MQVLTIEQHGQWLAADIQTPVSLYLGLVGHKQGLLLESASTDGSVGRYSVIGWNYALRLSNRAGKLRVGVRDSRLEVFRECEGQDFISGVRDIMTHLVIQPAEGFEDLPPITRSLMGYFGYGMAGLFEPKLAGCLHPEESEACLVLPGNLVLFDHLHYRLCFLSLTEKTPPQVDRELVSRNPEPPEVGEVRMDPAERAYKQAVTDTIELIRQGECIQTVLSSQCRAAFSGDSFTLYRRLRQINPSPYLFYMRLPGLELLGSSPELLVGCDNGRLSTCPVAGTRLRGKTAQEDEALARDLLNDPKERAEHVMLVDLGRNDLGRIATPGSVQVEKFMEVEKFSHVLHLSSFVSAHLREGLDALDVLAATFPAGTVSGAPKIRAMEIIADKERADRGPYAGAIGWIGLDKGRVDIDTGITIRSMWIRDKTLHWQAGAGIVFDSSPDAEWQECRNKAKVVRAVLAGKGGGDVLTD